MKVELKVMILLFALMFSCLFCSAMLIKLIVYIAGVMP